MDIAALSMSMSHTKVKQESSIAIMKMAMDAAKVQAEAMNKMLEANMEILESIDPYVGGNVDIMA
ncbi:YjfB family protein [Tissierella sp. Yu-01]|uniref:YjfB family protein n=1 Tax=Tissierella sp. Yu-01 TaxID=3035694 RepID=UPI00240DD34D|nr:YjfB family protein [Tissierella sp. Yu-01]WFA07923.1 YjfB family protein [Tissierella sp. Yu-01]